MNWLEKIKLIAHIIRWRLSWSRRSLDYCPKTDHPEKFISARQAAALIPDGSCVFSSGLAGNARCSIFFYAIRDQFLKKGHPKALSWINAGAQGSRGRVPGTVEELGLPGLMTAYLAGHLETAKAQLRLGQEGKLALYTLPQGIISLLLEEQGKGNQSIRSTVGLSTFLDPDFGTGAAVNELAKKCLIYADGEALLYTMPKPDIALFSAPYADIEGNIYFKHASTITENIPSIHAVRKNGGKVMVAISGIIPKEDKQISVPADQVDHIVVNPYNEQTISVPQRRFWPLFTPDAKVDFKKAVGQLKFINTFLKITPVRTEVGQMMGRLGASLFTQLVPRGGMINIGVGFPEEVARLVVEHGLEKEYIFTTEAGSYGGLPAPGIFFGAAIKPDHLESSSRMFERYHDHLDMAVLGFLEVDTAGNVNVSKRGDRITDYVGPGGFPDIVHGAKNIIFIGNWMHQAAFKVQNRELQVIKAGRPKFVQEVKEITFNGQEALRRKKQVFFVTDVGLFKLTTQGLTLIARFPGIRVQEDILTNTEADIIIPSGRDKVLIDAAIVSGLGFRPSLAPVSSDFIPTVPS